MSPMFKPEKKKSGSSDRSVDDETSPPISIPTFTKTHDAAMSLQESRKRNIN